MDAYEESLIHTISKMADIDLLLKVIVVNFKVTEVKMCYFIYTEHEIVNKLTYNDQMLYMAAYKFQNG